MSKQQSQTKQHASQGQDESHKDRNGASHHEKMFRKKFWISLMLSLPVLIFSQTVQGWLGYTLPDFPLSNWIVPVMSTVVFIVGGLPFLRMAKGELEDKKPGMMTLISLAILVAFFYSLASTFFHLGSSFYWELVTLIDVMLLGHWIEMRSIRQASGALDELSKLLPDKASKVNENGEIETVKVSELKKGDIVLIRPGESVPADGVVVEGQSNLNEAMITGESTPVPKQEGDTLVSGTINGDGSLRAKVTAVGEETTLAGIMRLVKEAQQSKSQTQILADRAAGWLFYTALGVAVITAIVWFLAVGWNIEILKRVTSVLVIACPHALGLAIPLVVAISTSIGASHGILIRDRVALESARKLDTIIFDKTGTLTHGEFGLQAMESIESISLERALSLAAAVERDSEHPLAKAIRDAAEGKIEAEGITGMTDSDLEIPPAESFEAIKGKGAKALVEGEWYLVGSERLLEEKGIALESTLSDFTDRHSTKGETVVYLIHADEALAAFALADRIRKASFETIDQLHQEGYRVAMLTGDSEEVARSVAEALEIDIVFAEVLPENKDRKVSELQEKGQRVAMVGDGVNDAPALTRADVGIAIGSGTDVAVESAGIILVDNDPKDILRVIRLSRETYQKMVQNLIWATGYNVIALPLAAGVLAPIRILLPPAVGALIMSLSTVIVAANAQLLRRLSEDL